MEGLCRGESCVKGEENPVSNRVPSKDESILSGGNGAIWLGGGGDVRLGKEGIPGNSHQTPGDLFGADPTSVMAHSGKDQGPGE